MSSIYNYNDSNIAGNILPRFGYNDRMSGTLWFKDNITGITWYFSYHRPVAFLHSSTGLVCMKNYWGNGTGRHLNLIQPDKKLRVDEITFTGKLLELYSRVGERNKVPQV